MSHSGDDLRALFLDYFRQNGHQVEHSYPLVPPGDPTLLFTNAGMVQFKNVFTGVEKRAYTRATSSQKCVRAGGKHNDLENVGQTARHHTFFEMLGNFSFGDYFKEEAISFGWEFLVDRVGLDPERLWVSVFEGKDEIPADEEAFKIWRDRIGVPEDRILRYGMKDNFWSMGDTGPCGPCSEVHYYQGPEAAGPPHECSGVDCECDAFTEVWNLVFMQFERHADGSLSPLPSPCIDTGMGLERLAAVAQGKLSNYDTDFFTPLLAHVAGGVGKTYGEVEEDSFSMRVVSDHARATAFLIADGVIPSNEGRGYVLRRIMRRAIRHGARLGYDDLFLHRACEKVIGTMGRASPELEASREAILQASQAEESRFRTTLDRGLGLLEEAIGAARKAGQTAIPGDVVFKLYDTYGFPADLTATIARERDLAVDEAGFEVAMERQRDRGKASWVAGGLPDQEEQGEAVAAIAGLPSTSFVGYDETEAEAPILLLLGEDGPVLECAEGARVSLVTGETPFYAESGGQVGDVGTIEGPEGRMEVEDTQKAPGGQHVHIGRVTAGKLAAGQPVRLTPDAGARDETRRNHSATHLLHHALRSAIGAHVK